MKKAKAAPMVGRADAANRRIGILDGIPVLNPKAEADEIALSLMKRLALPDRALADAAHIAVCVVHGIDYLLSHGTVRILPTRLFNP